MIQTLLLAAGFSRRFGDDKLMHKMDNGKRVIEQSIEKLQHAGQTITVVTRPQQTALIEWLNERHIPVCLCPEAEHGMGYSIACGVRATSDADGWLIHLADMPFIQPDTIRQVFTTLEQGDSICRPIYQGSPGHPVAFSRHYTNMLLNLVGDRGAKQFIQGEPVTLLECCDPGVLRDIDSQDDLRNGIQQK